MTEEDAMDYVNLGRTGLKVSRLCLGTMNFGSHTSADDSMALMDQALEIGINFFDTANRYPINGPNGLTEEIIGQWLAQGGRRERIVLATKVYGQMGDGPNDRGCSAYHIRQACEDSLRRLRTDHIDLYQMHHVDLDTPWEEVWQAMELLVRQGKVLYAGSSNFAAWHVATANQAAARRNFLGLVCEQSKYSLACRWIELEMLPMCQAYGVGVIAWSPLGGGLLAGVLGKRADGRRANAQVQRLAAARRDQIERYESLCKELGEEPAHVGLAWILSNPVMTAPIIGPRTMEQLTGSLRALQVELDEVALAKLNEVWPGPGGPAPQAYAW
jgi:aryl-alcohol dehydrogenase-like predicted oxidoreductase